MDIMDIEEVEEQYGKITSIEIISYYKFMFTLRFKCENFPDKKFMMETGGESNDIYRYCPHQCCWSEHDAAGISRIWDEE